MVWLSLSFFVFVAYMQMRRAELYRSLTNSLSEEVNRIQKCSDNRQLAIMDLENKHTRLKVSSKCVLDSYRRVVRERDFEIDRADRVEIELERARGAKQNLEEQLWRVLDLQGQYRRVAIYSWHDNESMIAAHYRALDKIQYLKGVIVDRDRNLKAVAACRRAVFQKLSYLIGNQMPLKPEIRAARKAARKAENPVPPQHRKLVERLESEHREAVAKAEAVDKRNSFWNGLALGALLAGRARRLQKGTP